MTHRNYARKCCFPLDRASRPFPVPVLYRVQWYYTNLVTPYEENGEYTDTHAQDAKRQGKTSPVPFSQQNVPTTTMPRDQLTIATNIA